MSFEQCSRSCERCSKPCEQCSRSFVFWKLLPLLVSMGIALGCFFFLPPGHGPIITVAEQLTVNPFFQTADWPGNVHLQVMRQSPTVLSSLPTSSRMLRSKVSPSLLISSISIWATTRRN